MMGVFGCGVHAVATGSEGVQWVCHGLGSGHRLFGMGGCCGGVKRMGFCIPLRNSLLVLMGKVGIDIGTLEDLLQRQAFF